MATISTGGSGESTQLDVKTAVQASSTETTLATASNRIGDTTDAAVITDASGTLSGKLRGAVKWMYERMPASLGAKSSSASFPVVIASDQAAVPSAQSGSWSVTVSSEPALALTTDVVGNSRRKRSVADALVERSVTVVTGTVSASTVSTTVVAAASAGVKINVAWFQLTNDSAANAVSVEIDSASSRKMVYQLAAGEKFGCLKNEDGWFETNAAEALNFRVGGGSAIGYTLGWFPGS